MIIYRTKVKKGMALVFVLFLATILLLLSASLLYISSVNYNFLVRSQNVTKAMSISESGVQIAYNKIKSRYYNVGITKLKPDIQFEATPLEIKTGTLKKDDTLTTITEKIYTQEVYHLNGNYFEYYFKDLTTSAPMPIYYRVTDNNWFDNGLVSGNSTKKYNVESITKNVKGEWSGVSADIEIERNSLFNYGIFFNDELEIVANSDMSIKGPVHSNDNIYLDSSAILNIDGNITSAGHIYRGRKNSEPLKGTVSIRNTENEPVNLTIDNDSLDTSANIPATDINWKQNALELWKGRVQDISHGVENKLSTNINLIGRNQYYEKSAKLRIVTSGTDTGRKNTETIQVLEPSGSPLYIKDIITLNPGRSRKESIKLNILGIPDDTFTTTSFTDEREKKTVRVTVIDINKLQLYQNWPDNNLIYATREDAIPDTNPEDGIEDILREPDGILLKNGSQLKTPLILVSNNPVYIQGDFNNHQKNDGTRITEENSDYGKPGVDIWQPAAVIADAVTLLSNAWIGKSWTVAENTEYNLAMVIGTVKDNISKGFIAELCRFLEQWDGKNARIRGSVIQLWHSQYATGNWKYGSPVYTEPNLDFSFDNSFSNNYLPPAFYDLFPSITERVEERNWKRIIDQQSIIYKDLKNIGVL